MNKIEWVENLRVIATITVIVLHVAGPGVVSLGSVSMLDWNIANFFDGFARFCVPVFIMITGSFILNKDYELKDFFKNKLSRIIIPFLIFSFIYIIDSYGFQKLIYNHDIKEFGLFTLQNLIYGSSFHLWYIYMLIGLYIISPIIRVYVKNASKSNLGYFLIAWLIFVTIHGYALNNYIPSFQISIFANYTGYFVLGYYLSKYPLNSPKLGWLLFITGSLLTIVGTYFFSVKQNQFYEMFYNYNTLNVILQSVGIYTILFNSTIKNKALSKLRDIISKNSFNIYLVHILILSKIAPLTWNYINPLVGIITTTLVCLFISTIVSMVLKQIPIVNRYL